MTPQAERALRTALIWLALVIAAICLAGPFLVLAGCAQRPTSKDLWLAIQAEQQ